MNKHKAGVPSIRVIRAIFQILFFLFLPALYITAFSGVKQIMLGILHHNVSLSTLPPQMVAAFAIIPFTIVLGRFFCGWMCSFGAMGDFIYGVTSIFWRKKPRISEPLDRVFKTFKYIWLAVLILAVWIAGTTVFSASNPWDAFGMLLTIGKKPDFSFVFANLLPAFLLFIGIVVGSVFVRRFFCRYLCPLGAIFAVTSKLRATSIQKPRTSCGKCRICTNNCPMGIPLYKTDESKSGECIMCLNCVAACPRKNVTLAVSGSRMRPAVAGAMAVSVMTGIYYAGSFSTNLITEHVAAAGTSQTASSSRSGSTSSAESSAASSSVTLPADNSSSSSSAASAVTAKYKDGTYQGSGTGFRGGTTTVSVTVKGGKISDVQVVSTDDDQMFFNRAYSSLSHLIVQNQSPQVDTVSGATYSSNGIMEAVANALKKAAE